jgi:UvrD-like helicase C-terminal domain
VGYRARINYRSLFSIAQPIRKALPFEFECRNDLPVLGVGVTPYDRPEGQSAAVARLVGELVRHGFDHEEIVILTLRGAKNSLFSDRERVGNFTRRRFTGGCDLFGNQVLTPGHFSLDSVRLFKGQQVPAVVLVEVESDPRHPDLSAHIFYAGMARASVRLDLLVKGDDRLRNRFQL